MTNKMNSFFKNLPDEYYSIDRPKQSIALSIKEKIEKENTSLRKLAENIDGMSYSQIHRITSRQNYTIESLLKVLDALDLEITIRPKSK